MCNDRSYFISYKGLPSPMTIKLGDESTMTATYHGLTHITQDLQLDVLYTPTFRLSLLSISKLELAGYTMTFRSGKCFISTDTNSTASIIITANHIGDLYILQSPYVLTSKTSQNDPTITTKTIPSNTTTAFQSKAITSHRERKKQSQTTKMTSDLTPASTITAGLWH